MDTDPAVELTGRLVDERERMQEVNGQKKQVGSRGLIDSG